MKDTPSYINTKDIKKMATLAKQYVKADPAKKKTIVDKNKLVSLVSKARGGVIFGAINDAERSKGNIVVGLDEKGKMIFVYGKPAKVYDPASFLNKVVVQEDFEDDTELELNEDLFDDTYVSPLSEGYKKKVDESEDDEDDEDEDDEDEDEDDVTEEKGDKAAYEKFFKKAMKKFGVDEPDELKGDKKKEFFDYIDKNWEGDNEKKEEVSLEHRRLHAKVAICLSESIDNVKHNFVESFIEDSGLNEFSTAHEIFAAYNDYKCETEA